MKLLILFGFAILFVSTFFIFFLLDSLTEKNILCQSTEAGIFCNFRELGLSFVLRLIVIGIFTAIDVYIVSIMFGEIAFVGGLKKRYQELLAMKRIAEKDYYRKEIDEATFKKLILGYEKELAEVRVKIREKERGLHEDDE
ncbi:MAG: hypothetical protein HY518_01705 [Candidatus Aenigmarchaeota archaeon]|nr:hypothetical protein [Candidatus Aenigmarchaeota archaeon]